MKIIKHILFLSAVLLLMASCQQSSQDQANDEMMQGEGIEVSDAWARPGAEGRMSAAYF